MTRRTFKLFIMAIALQSPTLVLAASCQSIMNTINNDINQYGDDLKSKSLNWMSFTWLKKSLGNPDTKEKFNEQVSYTWHCENDGGMLKVTLNQKDRVESLEGQYVSSNGAGIFATEVPEITATAYTSKQPAQIVQAIAPIEPAPINSPVVALNEVINIAGESACDKSIRQINHDVSSFTNLISNQKLPWMNLSWLNEALGTAFSTQAYAYLYEWDQYQLYIAADGSKDHVGVLPDKNETESVDEITSLLGKAKEVNLETLTQYTWRCPVNNGSALTAWLNKDNQISYLIGKTCTVDRCQKFEAEIFGNQLLKILKNKKQNFAYNSPGQSNPKVKKYNEYYKVSLTSDNEVNSDINKRVKAFYANLRLCVPGVYEYAVPVAQEFLFNTSTIKKEKTENRCIVETKYSIPHIGLVTLKCRYQDRTLQLFNDNVADFISNGQTSFNADHPSAIQLAEENECKRYINGVL